MPIFMARSRSRDFRSQAGDGIVELVSVVVEKHIHKLRSKFIYLDQWRLRLELRLIGGTETDLSTGLVD